MKRGGARFCAITGLAIAVIGAIVAFTFPPLYHAILNYVYEFPLNQLKGLELGFLIFYLSLMIDLILGTVAAVWHVAV